MAIRPPALDDRGFDDLVTEILSLIPAHTPRYTNPRLGDPGRTLIELFAWLTDTLLYRANLIPERQRLTFLRLLGIQMRAAIPAQTVVSVLQDNEDAIHEVVIQPRAQIKGPVQFETRSELTVLPVTAQAYYKRPLCSKERAEMAEVVRGLRRIYQLRPGEVAEPYVTTPVFVEGGAEPDGFDIMSRTVDKCLWLALLASKPEMVEQIRQTLGESQDGRRQLISIGVMPSISVPALFEEIGHRAQIPHLWEITGGDELEYHALDRIADTTAELTQRGVQRLALPAPGFIGAPSNDVRDAVQAGVADRPPRIDDEEMQARLLAWLRLRPTVRLESLSLSWVGINAAEIDQRQTITGRVVGQTDGSADQMLQLPGQSVEEETLEIQVEESGRGYQKWRQIDDLALAGRDAAVFSLDTEAGTIQLGDGIRGRIPALGSRVRVKLMRFGGGSAGNLPPGSLAEISARDLSGKAVNTLKVSQPLATVGGEDTETLAEAERRIPALFRHRDRLVVQDDYQHLAARTPGVRLARAEVLPRFKPHQRRNGVPGVVSVMIFPLKEAISPPNPRADRPTLETVHAYLDARRPLGTELYVIGCEYIPLGLSASVGVADGAEREAVLRAVREAFYTYLWPLPPGGPQEAGWPLGSTVRDRELEVVAARVPGIVRVNEINLFERQDDDWRMIGRTDGLIEIELEEWQLPELLTVVVVADDPDTGEEPRAPTHLRGVPNPFARESGIAIPVVPEVCF